MLLAPKGIDKSNKKGTTEPSNNDSQEVPKDLEKQLRELLSEQSSESQLPSNRTITRPVKTNVLFIRSFKNRYSYISRS